MPVLRTHRRWNVSRSEWTPEFRAMRRKFWLYVSGAVLTVTITSWLVWNIANIGVSVAMMLMTFVILAALGNWYTRQLREARSRGEIW